MRTTCRRCLRPEAFCVCDHLPTLTPRIRVVILQHPREVRLAICSAWLTHVALAGSELYPGFCFEEHPRVRVVHRPPAA